MFIASPSDACYAPAALFRRCFCARRRVHALCNLDFDSWIASNPLPGRRPQPPSFRGGDDGGAAGRGGSSSSPTDGSLPGCTAHRFGLSEAPAVAAAFVERYSSCKWSLQGPGLLAAHEDSGSGAAVARLALPRLLAGSSCCASLWASSSASDVSPLTIFPEAEEQQLRQALAALAALHGGGGSCSSSSSSSGPSSIGSQLLVLLSADSAALALYSKGQLLLHKVHTGYTVRRQQGKAQATYERQGGGEAGWGALARLQLQQLFSADARLCVALRAGIVQQQYMHQAQHHRVHQALPFPTAAGARSVGGSIRARETRRLFQAAAATLAGWEADIAGCSLLFRSGSGDAVVGVIGTACFGQLEHASDTVPSMA